MCVSVVGRVWLFATPWIVNHQAPLSMEFSKQEYWNRLPFPYSKVSCQPRDWICISSTSCIDRQILYHCVTWEVFKILCLCNKRNNKESDEKVKIKVFFKLHCYLFHCTSGSYKAGTIFCYFKIEVVWFWHCFANVEESFIPGIFTRNCLLDVKQYN